MKIYALVGKSGTGKSYQAVNLCKELNIESIIDDGLFICRSKVLAGISAKRQPTKIAAVRTALFHEDDHMESVNFMGDTEVEEEETALPEPKEVDVEEMKEAVSTVMKVPPCVVNKVFEGMKLYLESLAEVTADE